MRALRGFVLFEGEIGLRIKTSARLRVRRMGVGSLKHWEKGLARLPKSLKSFGKGVRAKHSATDSISK